MAITEKQITPEGERKIREELEQLTGPARTAMAARLRTAIQQGDLSENADYIMAKEDQGFLEGRILELEALLRDAEVVKPEDGPKDVVTLGCRVTVSEGDEAPEDFFLVGNREANPKERKISHESPIGKVLMGHRIGDIVNADTPGGAIQFKIIAIQ
jgi:transcription elongation factor GreA